MGRVVSGIARFGGRLLRGAGDLVKGGLSLVGKAAKFALPLVGLAAPFLIPGVGGAITGLLGKFGGAGGLFGGLAAKCGTMFGGLGGSLAGLGARVGSCFSGCFGPGTSLGSLCSTGLSTMRGWGASLGTSMQAFTTGPNAATNMMMASTVLGSATMIGPMFSVLGRDEMYFPQQG